MMSPNRLLSLPQLQHALATELAGGGPSIATLKRWAATGILDAARVQDVQRDGKPAPRVRFDLNLARRLVLQRWGEAPQPPAARSSPSRGPRGPAPGAEAAATAQATAIPEASAAATEMRELRAQLHQLGEQVRLLAQGQAELQREATELRATRLALMRKYDESNAMQLQLIAQLKSQRGSPSGGDSVLELSRLAAGISRVHDRLSRLESHWPGA